MDEQDVVGNAIAALQAGIDSIIEELSSLHEHQSVQRASGQVNMDAQQLVTLIQAKRLLEEDRQRSS